LKAEIVLKIQHAEKHERSAGVGRTLTERRLRDVIAISISMNWFAAPFAEHGRRNAQRVCIPLQIFQFA
jgi:hypothetical protein